MAEGSIEPGMYVRLSHRVVSEDPADEGGAFGLVGDPLAVGGFLTCGRGAAWVCTARTT